MDEKEKTTPSMRAYGRQLFICQNGTCAPTETAVSTTANSPTNTLPTMSMEVDFNSISEIEKYLQNGEKPTLVEFYSDFGIS